SMFVLRVLFVQLHHQLGHPLFKYVRIMFLRLSSGLSTRRQNPRVLSCFSDERAQSSPLIILAFRSTCMSPCDEFLGFYCHPVYTATPFKGTRIFPDTSLGKR